MNIDQQKLERVARALEEQDVKDALFEDVIVHVLKAEKSLRRIAAAATCVEADRREQLRGRANDLKEFCATFADLTDRIDQ